MGGRGRGKVGRWRNTSWNTHKERDQAAVLSGRCYEREDLPYKAFDGLLDALGRHLLGLSPADLRGLLPHDVRSRQRRVFRSYGTWRPVAPGDK